MRRALVFCFVLTVATFLVADQNRIAKHGPPTIWAGTSFSDGAAASAMFSAHADDPMPPVMVTTHDLALARTTEGKATWKSRPSSEEYVTKFIVFVQVHQVTRYIPETEWTCLPFMTNAGAAARVDASKARLRGMTSLPDGQIMVWEIR